jgi:hypothetical protein
LNDKSESNRGDHHFCCKNEINWDEKNRINNCELKERVKPLPCGVAISKTGFSEHDDDDDAET